MNQWGIHSYVNIIFSNSDYSYYLWLTSKMSNVKKVHLQCFLLRKQNFELIAPNVKGEYTVGVPIERAEGCPEKFKHFKEKKVTKEKEAI